jgi:hypothetical protein
MKPRCHNFYLPVVLALLFGVSSCTRSDVEHASHRSLPWGEQFKEKKQIVLTAPWEQAENAYAELDAGVSTPDEMKIWIGFQIEILDETESDPLKDEIRKTAASILKDYPDFVRPYVKHLKDGLAANKYQDAEIRDWINFAIKTVEARDRQ